jgi:hypothetical protein
VCRPCTLPDMLRSSLLPTVHDPAGRRLVRSDCADCYTRLGSRRASEAGKTEAPMSGI